jgi:hypothetical protein
LNENVLFDGRRDSRLRVGDMLVALIDNPQCGLGMIELPTNGREFGDCLWIQ